MAHTGLSKCDFERAKMGPIIAVLYLSVLANGTEEVRDKIKEKLDATDPASATVCVDVTAATTKLERIKLQHMITGRNFKEDPNLYLGPKP